MFSRVRAVIEWAKIALVLDTPKGRGVFAVADISAGTVLETCPVLVLDDEENRTHIEKTELYHYTYHGIYAFSGADRRSNWPCVSSKDNGSGFRTRQALALGLGSMFNHSASDQNVGWSQDVEHQIITYHALRDIKAGEELCISYGSRLTFVDTDSPEAHLDEGDGSDLLGNIQLD